MSEAMETQADGTTATYTSGRGLRIVLAVGFFLFFLFVINAAAGAVWLVTHNLPATAIIFGLMFVLGAWLLIYLTVFLFAASHTEIRLGPDIVSMVLPNWRGPTPFFPYHEIQIPYSEISAVETRGEIYRYVVIPLIVRGASIISKNGERVTLGYVRDNPSDPPIPYDRIAEEIAQRAGVPVTKHGYVEAPGRMRTMVQDEPSWDTPECAPERLAEAQRRQAWVWLLAGGLLIATLIVALAYQTITLYT